MPSSSPKGSGQPDTEITSGGPGSEDDNCCGITTGIKADTKYFFIATEDWTEPAFSHGKQTFFCGRGGKPPCEGTGQSPPLINNTMGVSLSWHCDQKIKPGHVVYCGRLDNKSGCGPGYFAAFTDPMYMGRLIRPNSVNLLGGDKKKAEDPSRVRTDGLGVPDFGMPSAVAE
jgi:hypothetical protein